MEELWGLVYKCCESIRTLRGLSPKWKDKGGKKKKEGLERKIEEPIGGQLKLVLGLLLIEVRGLDFIHNLFV